MAKDGIWNSAWASIETAPHNRDILVWDAFTDRSVVARLACRYDDPAEPHGWLTPAGEVVGDPTHWQALEG